MNPLVPPPVGATALYVGPFLRRFYQQRSALRWKPRPLLALVLSLALLRIMRWPLLASSFSSWSRRQPLLLLVVALSLVLRQRFLSP